MDYEKKYNEALERAKQKHGKFSEFVTKTIEEIFPELRESEDEIVRKGIIDGMKCIQERGRILFYGMPIKDVIVWLEKQKEQKPAEQDSEEVFDKIDSSFRKGREVGFKEGVESVKPAEWSEEDKQWLESIIREYEERLPVDKDHAAIIQVKIDLLKSLRPRSSWKPSEEDKEMKLKVLKYLSTRCSVEQFEEVEEWLNNKLK